jgi:hypothetical protein
MLLRPLALLIALSGAAQAEGPPLLQLEVAGNRLDVGAEGIALVAIEQGQGGLAVRVRLENSYDARLVALTEGQIGQEIILRVCGAEVMRPTLRDALTRAEFMLSGSNAEMQQIARRLHAPDCAAELTG